MKIAIIGAGKMGGALLERLLDAGFVSKTDILACDLNETRLNELKEKLQIEVSRDNKRGAKFGDLVIVAVMPKQVRGVLEEIRPEISESKKSLGAQPTLILGEAIIPADQIQGRHVCGRTGVDDID